MSQRVKRPNRSEDGSVPVKRRKRTAAEEEEAASLAAGAWQPPRSNDLKSIYNRTTTEAPAELFRKDLISAMKLPDSEPLALDEYWVIVDQWKQEWERGVQVPVNPDSLPEPSVTVTHCNNVKVANEFKLPKNKYIRITKDDNFKPDDHSLSLAPAQSEAACSYDLDECDVSWLRLLNSDRASSGLGPVYEDQLERVIERFEVHCWEKIQSILRDEEGLGIEYDENVICDVCRSPDSEEGNEMVFCDSCNICVHQACYGITRIPEGQWLCCTCNISKRPECVLCPHKGGAMKCTRSGQKWAHVSCALWIPEVSIGCVEKMEPITKISSIPASRWALICVLCRERVGACIQCSVKTCKTAYHVTCAFKHGLEMRAIIEDENADDGVKLRSYCEKHSKSSKKEKSVCSGSENDDDCKRKKRKDMTSEEKNQARAARLQEIEAEFYKHVAIKDVTIIDVDIEALQYIYNYWKLKRKAGSNKPLLLPKSEDVDMLSHKREQADLEKMKMFVQLRQDLERVRNLCYMVSRREKLSRTFFRMREQTFHKQAAVFDVSPSLPTTVSQAVIEANHGPSIYDRLYSHSKAEDHMIDFDTILARISGNKSPVSGDEKKPEINGLFKDVKNNPYKKEYFNGSSKRRSCSLYGSSLSSASSSDERPKDNKENRLYTSSEDEKPPILIKKSTPSPRKPNRTKSTTAKALERKHKKQLQSRSKIETSSEEDVKPPPTPKWGQSSRSRLMQVENELGESAGSESDELMPIRSTTQKSDNAKMKSMSSIYSDSDDSSTDVSMRNESSTNDSQSRLRTKAAVKEFSHKPSTSNNKSSPEGKKKVKQPDVAHVNKKKDYVPSDLIVPQRQAAKKATENLKSNTSRVNKEVVAVPVEEAKVEVNAKPHHQPKVKVKASSKVEEIEKEVEKDPEILAFVPQRQAAKKAAEHIKSGLGKPNANAAAAGNDSASEGAKKEQENAVKAKKEEVKASKAEKKPVPSDIKRKSSSNSSSSSSSSTSSSTSSSSSSESEEDRAKPQAQPRLESLFSPSSRESTKRSNAKDWPFLDKVSKTKASSSSSDSSDSSAASSPTPPAQSKAADTTTNKRKTGDTKQSAPIAKREELARGGRGRAIKSKFESAADRVGDVDVRIGDSTDKDRSAAKCRKSDESSEKEIVKSDKLRSPPAKADKKVKSSPEISNLEKEILERKAGKEGALRTKSTLDRLFGSDKKNDVLVENAVKADRNKSPQKITKEEKKLPKKSPLKTNKSIDDIFANKIANSESKENKVDVNIKLDVPKISKASEEITLADKIVEDHLQLHKSKELYNSNMDIKEFDFEKKNATKHTSTNVLQNRSIFSPQPHSLDFDHFDDNFGISKDDEIMKGPLQFTFNNSALIKEDTKEDSARETLNLVEKLRMEYSKKSSSCDVDDVVPTTENDRSEYSEQVVPQNHISDVVVPKLPEIVEPKVEVLPKQFPSADHATYLTENKTNIPLTDHSIPIQGDERWVPPSESYPNIQSADPATYLNDSISIPHVEPYVAPPPLVNTPILPQPKQHLNSVLAQLDVRLHEEALKTQSPLLDRRILQTPLMDPASMDMPSPSPYGAKWTDSELMPNRRSSSSSAASSSSSSSRRNDQEDEPKMIVNHPALEMSYLASQVPHVAATAAPVDFSAFSEASQFVSPVSLFHPTLNTQLPFPPTGFPPQFGAPFPTPHTIPSLPKPVEDTTIPPYSASCTAAFTSSQHNMALTAAMVNLPPAKIIEAVPEKVIEVPKIVTTANPLPSPSSSLKSNSSVGKKSPTKPTRTSARVTSQVNKSPMTGKSPGKSPRQEQVKQTGPGRGKDVKRNSGKVNSARANQNQARSRGRGRGRGRGAHHDFDFIGANTIHNKLVGTVYDLDFDDDISNDNMMSDLKSMRERRKSSDFHDRKFDSFSSPNSPKFSSPTSHKNRNYSTDLRELRPPTPIVETDSRSKSESINSNETETTQTFPDVTPVLPGPVDMRTYNSSFDQQSYNESNLLSAFASGTTVTQVHEDIDEDFEKELHTALGKKPVEVVEPIGNIKVSLSDSRNQLKVKIKGPIANYTSTVVPLPPPTVDPIVVSNMNVNSVTNNAVTSASRSMSSGSIWRVRKKELLRQYCSQDLNATDEAVAPVLAAVPQVNRTIITIPKAVASMTSIPTKDDYRDYRTGADDFENKHHKKIRPGLSRELRQLESSMDEKNDAANKRRGRPPRPSTQPTAPKLKIKIGSTNSIVGKIDDKKDRIRPPKKRCLSSTIAMPTVEDLKRDSMKFRKMVMADLKVKKKKKEKGEKRKKKNKTKSEVQIISNQCENPTKLIIRFGKKAEETTTTSVESKSEVVVNNSKKPDGESAKVVPSDASANVVANAKTSDSRNDKVAPVVKLTPIKLKLSRCQAGSGYVMKAPETKAAETIQVPVTQAPPPLPINKDCEVR